MRALLGVLGVVTVGTLLATTRAPAEPQQAAQPSPSPKAPTASPSPKKSYTDEDLARYKAMRPSPSPAAQDSAAPSKPSPPRFAAPRGTAASGSTPEPYRRPGARPATQEGGGSPVKAEATPSPSPGAPPPAADDQSTPSSEAEWRQRGRAASAAVKSARAQVPVAESAANALFTQQLQSTDTNEIMRLRQEVADATQRVDAAKKAVTDAEAALAHLEEAARQAGIPQGYLRDDTR